MKIDLTGKKFGKLTAIKINGKNKHGDILWLCRCDCGKEKCTSGWNLRRGITRSCGCIPVGKPAKDLVGRRFGRLIVLERVDKPKEELTGIYVYYKCQCDCGEIIVTRATALTSKVTKSCGCSNKQKISDRFWRGTEGLSMTYFSKVRRSSEHRNIIFNLTPQDMWEQFVQQDGKCIFSGETLVMLGKGSGLGGSWNGRHTASLDRIDSSKGYIVGNIQWVHKDINRIKGCLTDEQLLDWIKKIYEYKFKY